MYLDIGLFKEVTNADLTEETQITETSGKVTITIAIPEELINTNSSVDRTYRIIRVHEDENGNLITDVIEGIYDSITKTFTFETDKFSTYALAYNDKTAETSVEVTKDADANSCTVKYTIAPEDLTKIPVMYIAFYNSRNVLIDVKAKENIVSSDEFTISIPSGSEKCKVTLWTPKIMPLCQTGFCEY